MAASLAGGGPALPDPVLTALVVGGYGQVLAASLAYLGPVLRGGAHERLAAGFSLTGSWWGIAAGNGAAAALAAGHTGVGIGLLGGWVADSAWRAVRLVSAGKSERPADRKGAGPAEAARPGPAPAEAARPGPAPVPPTTNRAAVVVTSRSWR
jgi:hypothetical protein